MTERKESGSSEVMTWTVKWVANRQGEDKVRSHRQKAGDGSGDAFLLEHTELGA